MVGLKQDGYCIIKYGYGFRAGQKHAYTVSRGLCHLWTYGAAMIYATNTIKRNNEAGMKVRADIFFIAATDDSSSADDAEVVLLAAQMEHDQVLQEFACQHRIFSPSIVKSRANLLIKPSHGLSYRQLCLLSIFSQPDRFKLRPDDYTSDTRIIPDIVALLQEIYEMEKLARIIHFWKCSFWSD